MKNYVKYPIIPIAFFYVNGIFFSNQLVEIFSIQLMWIFLLVVTFIFIFILFLFKFRQKYLLPKAFATLNVFLLFFLVGCVSYQSSKFENKLVIGNQYLGVITINEVLRPNEFQNRYFGDFKTDSGIQQKILIYQNIKKPHLKIGDRLLTNVLINAISDAKNPYQFNYAKYLANKNIFVQTKLSDVYTNLESATGLYYQLLYFRTYLMKSFDIQHFSKEVKGVVYALLFGQRADLSEKVQADYRNAGVMHILAISGMHIGILYWIINLIFSSFIRSKNYRFFVVISILICFAVISGLSGSVIRAVLMFFIAGSGVFLNRKTSTTNVLVLSMLLILIVNPNFLFDIGFQMSYLAVFSIVYIYPLIQNKIKSRYLFFNYFYELLGISLVAQLGILPLTVYYFGQIPLLFLMGNLIVIPVLTVVLIALVFLLILNFIWKYLAVILGDFVSMLINFSNTAIAFIGSNKAFILSDIKLNLLQCLLFLAIIFLSAYTLKKVSYLKCISVLSLVLILQLTYLFDLYKAKSNNQLQMMYDYNHLAVLKITNQKMLVFGSDSLILQKKYISDLKKEHKIDKIDFILVQNFFKANQLHFLVVDSSSVVKSSAPVDVLILKDNPKFNLSRYLLTHKPKLIIFHPKNYKSTVVFWQQTCLERQIPFHNMSEKGFVDFKKTN